MKINRRAAIVSALGALAASTGIAALVMAALPANAADEITVYKSPTCSCCGEWVEHLRAEGFAVAVQETDNVAPVKARVGIPPALASCHTALVGGYAIEGHVPAREIRRLLSERPGARGLAVPGMPSGSPGMGGPAEPYDVILFGDGGQSVYARY
jgi:hypothetical protein